MKLNKTILVNKINIACVLNIQDNPRGPRYSIEWVDKLYRGISRNLDLKFNFICFSNISTPYDTIPLVSNSDIFWNKIELFRKDLLQGPTLYLDLDTVVCKNITDVIIKLPQDQFIMVREPNNKINSSIMFWNSDYSYLFDEYINNKDKIVQQYWTTGPKGFGDQVYISERVNPILINDHSPNNFVGWRHNELLENPIIDPSLLLFTSRQKPNNNLNLPIVREHWI